MASRTTGIRGQLASYPGPVPVCVREPEAPQLSTDQLCALAVPLVHVKGNVTHSITPANGLGADGVVRQSPIRALTPTWAGRWGSQTSSRAPCPMPRRGCPVRTLPSDRPADQFAGLRFYHANKFIIAGDTYMTHSSLIQSLFHQAVKIGGDKNSYKSFGR